MNVRLPVIVKEVPLVPRVDYDEMFVRGGGASVHLVVRQVQDTQFLQLCQRVRLGSLIVLRHRGELCGEHVAASLVAQERGRVEQNVRKRVALERVVPNVEEPELGAVSCLAGHGARQGVVIQVRVAQIAPAEQSLRNGPGELVIFEVQFLEAGQRRQTGRDGTGEKITWQPDHVHGHLLERGDGPGQLVILCGEHVQFWSVVGPLRRDVSHELAAVRDEHLDLARIVRLRVVRTRHLTRDVVEGHLELAQVTLNHAVGNHTLGACPADSNGDQGRG